MIEELRKKQIEKEVESIYDFKLKVENKSIELREQIMPLFQSYLDTPTQESFFIMMGALSSCLYSISSLFFLKQDELDEACEELNTIIMDRILPDLNKITPCGKCIECLNADFENCTEPDFDSKLTTSPYIVLLVSRLLDCDAYFKNVSNRILNFVETEEEAEIASSLIADRMEQEAYNVK